MLSGGIEKDQWHEMGQRTKELEFNFNLTVR